MGVGIQFISVSAVNQHIDSLHYFLLLVTGGTLPIEPCAERREHFDHIAHQIIGALLTDRLLPTSMPSCRNISCFLAHSLSFIVPYHHKNIGYIFLSTVYYPAGPKQMKMKIMRSIMMRLICNTSHYWFLLPPKHTINISFHQLEFYY